MKLNCIAIDDERYALELLADNIKRVPYLQLAGTCKNTVEAATLMAQQKIDLVFIDIQMPGTNGLQFIEGILPKPLVIFVTAYDNYALKAFNADAIDYLVKPVSFERFLQATNKALSFSNFREQPVAGPEEAFIFLNVEYNLVKVVLSEIMYIEGVKDYIKIHLSGARKVLMTRNTMKGILEILPSAQFIRIHRSYIVSYKWVSIIKKDSVVLMDQETRLPLSESYRLALAGSLGK